MFDWWDHVVVLTSTPRLSRCLMSSFLANSIWLSLVFCHSSVDTPKSAISISIAIWVLSWETLLDNVGADGRPEDGGKRVSLSTRLTLRRSDGDGRTGRHVGGDCW